LTFFSTFVGVVYENLWLRNEAYFDVVNDNFFDGR